MIYQTIDNAWQLGDAFREAGRDHYTNDGYDALFDMLDEWGGEAGYDLDVVAVCCDFTEYDAEELFSDYGYLVGDAEEGEGEDGRLQRLMEKLEDRTTAVSLRNGHVLVQAF
jgi:hypothetical protein